jgi:hypothetical protein
MLKKLVRYQKPTITEKEQLWETLLTAHGMLVNNRDFSFNLIHSMPARMQEVLRRDENVTRY